jgi:hypothetical protein
VHVEPVVPAGRDPGGNVRQDVPAAEILEDLLEFCGNLRARLDLDQPAARDVRQCLERRPSPRARRSDDVDDGVRVLRASITSSGSAQLDVSRPSVQTITNERPGSAWVVTIANVGAFEQRRRAGRREAVNDGADLRTSTSAARAARPRG